MRRQSRCCFVTSHHITTWASCLPSNPPASTSYKRGGAKLVLGTGVKRLCMGDANVASSLPATQNLNSTRNPIPGSFVTSRHMPTWASCLLSTPPASTFYTRGGTKRVVGIDGKAVLECVSLSLCVCVCVCVCVTWTSCLLSTAASS